MTKTFKEEAEKLLIRFADQIDTLRNKLHHKEINHVTFDKLYLEYRMQTLADLQQLHDAEVAKAEKAAMLRQCAYDDRIAALQTARKDSE